MIGEWSVLDRELFKEIVLHYWKGSDKIQNKIVEVQELFGDTNSRVFFGRCIDCKKINAFSFLDSLRDLLLGNDFLQPDFSFCVINGTNLLVNPCCTKIKEHWELLIRTFFGEKGSTKLFIETELSQLPIWGDFDKETNKWKWQLENGKGKNVRVRVLDCSDFEEAVKYFNETKTFPLEFVEEDLKPENIY